MAIQISAPAVRVKHSGSAERGKRCVTVDEPAAADWRELADGDAAARHDEALACVQCPHDFAAVVTKLSLSQVPRHTSPA
ncbi:MAG TPA: hypothetical protein VE127_02220 [Solirubrobacteraceae bacterium]|nr:hypothetical protein [Solirubrobacteraceae bacterium]